MCITMHREESLIYYLQNDKVEEATGMAARVYHAEKGQSHDHVIHYLQSQLKPDDND